MAASADGDYAIPRRVPGAVPRWEHRLSLLAWLLFILLLVPPFLLIVLATPDAWWSTGAPRMVLQVFDGVGELVFLLLLGTTGILRLRREAAEQPEAWSLFRQMRSLRFLLVGVILMLALVVWWQVENIGVFPSGTTHLLPSWLSPLVIVAMALVIGGGLLVIPELIWRLWRARRTERR